MTTNYIIPSTPCTNDAAGWRALAMSADTMTAEALADICQWNDRNGEWSYANMRDDEHLTDSEIHDICRDQITAWADELAA